MIEGRCPKCGRRYYGWALLQPRNQCCSECGSGLMIIKDGTQILEGYSPFTAENDHIYMFKDTPKDTPSKGKVPEP